MSEETTVKKQEAFQYYVRHPKYSYGIFCISPHGDLFLNSDWGFYGTSWRAFGDDFKKFITEANADYIFDKLECNHRYLMKKDLPKHVRVPVKELINEFRKALKDEIDVQ
jgi:hypothetical protein